MKFIYRIVVVAIFLSVLGLVIAYARGYRFDMEKKSLSPTGIIAISSYPNAAKVFVNGELKGATNINMTLPPGNYNVEVKKDGYTNWNKKIVLKGELVLTLDALLFPLNASLSPLTNLGVVKAVPLDQTDKVLIFTDNNDNTKDGIYLFEPGNRPLNLLSPLKLLLLKSLLPANTDFHTVIVYTSPDLKQAIIEFPQGKTQKTISSKSIAYLISLEDQNTTLFDITTSKNTLLEAWNKEKDNDQQKVIETFPKEIAKIATDSFHIISFSPNETKIFYQANQAVNLPLAIEPPLIATNQTPDVRMLKKDHIYVYDKKEDKNYEIVLPTTDAAFLDTIDWYNDSKHLIFNENKKISVIDYDGSNKQVVYSGPFENSFFSVSGNGGLMILANLNPEANSFPDLYEVGIK